MKEEKDSFQKVNLDNINWEERCDDYERKMLLKGKGAYSCWNEKRIITDWKLIRKSASEM